MYYVTLAHCLSLLQLNRLNLVATALNRLPDKTWAMWLATIGAFVQGFFACLTYFFRNSMGAEVKDLKTQVDQQGTTITAHQSDIDQQRTTITNHQSEIDKQSTKITDHEKEIDKQRTTIAEHQTKIDEQRKEIDDMKTAMEALRTSLNNKISVVDCTAQILQAKTEMGQELQPALSFFRN